MSPISLRRNKASHVKKSKKSPFEQPERKAKHRKEITSVANLSTVDENSVEANDNKRETFVRDIPINQRVKSVKSSPLPRLPSLFSRKGSSKTQQESPQFPEPSSKPNSLSSERLSSYFGLSNSSRISTDSIHSSPGNTKLSKSSSFSFRSPPGRQSSSSKLSGIFSKSLWSNPNSRSSTPLSDSTPNSIQPLNNSAPSRKSKNFPIFSRRRGGSVSSLPPTNNSSLISLFSFGTRDQRQFGENFGISESSRNSVSNHGDGYYASISRPSFGRNMHVSVSEKSFAEMKRFSDYTNERRFSDWELTDKNNFRNSVGDISGRPKSSFEQYSLFSSTEPLADSTPLRISSDATTASTSGSSIAKVTFDIPNATVTHPEISDSLNLLSPNSLQLLESPSKTLPKSLSSSEDKYFPLFPPVGPKAIDTTPMNDSSALNYSLHLTNQKITPSVPNPSESMASSSIPFNASSFKAPLLKLRRKTVSMLFSHDYTSEDEPIASPSQEYANSHKNVELQPSSFRNNPSNPESPASQTATFSTSQHPTPFSIVRSYSSQNLPLNNSASETLGNDTGNLTPKPITNRRRSRTLSSIEPIIPSFNGLFSGKRADSVSVTPSLIPRTPPLKTDLNTIHRLSINLQDIASLALPPREDSDTPEGYMAKVREIGLGSYTAGALAKYDNEFYKAVLRLYLQLFNFFNFPLDMALRKFLISVRLPKETQQIDRVLEAFAFRYQECNPSIYSSAENAYFVVFSLMILHTDFFNKNNKFKMQKSDYFKNTETAHISKDILSCFYDNITYTPFIHTDDDLLSYGQSPRLNLPARSNTFGRTPKNLMDPYSLLLEDKLDSIRPNLDCVSFNDPFSFVAFSREEFLTLRKDFEDGQSLQLISQRSRPGAFLSPDSLGDPNSSGPGVVDIKVVKAGFLYKLEGKRRNMWREWGIILTASQLYFFKDTNWFRSNIMQNSVPNQPSNTLSTNLEDLAMNPEFEAKNTEMSSVKIRPLLEGFQPHLVLRTADLAALKSEEDAPQNRFCFLLAQKGGTADWFSSHIDFDLTDWMLKINYAASFNTFYVNIIHSPSPRRCVRKLQSLRGNNIDSAENSENVSIASKLNQNTESDKKYSENHFARKANVEQKLQTINTHISNIESQLKEHERTGRGLKLLAPIQPRTREAVFLSAATLKATLHWKWMERCKFLSYKAYFEMDLLVESEICRHLQLLNELASSVTVENEDETNSSETLPDTESVTTTVKLSEYSSTPDEDATMIASNGVTKPPVLLQINTHRRTVSDSSFYTTISGVDYDQISPTPTSSTASVFYDARSFATSFHSLASLRSQDSVENLTPFFTPVKRASSQYRPSSTSQFPMSPQASQSSKSGPSLRSQRRASLDGMPGQEIKSPVKRMQMTLRSPGSKRKSHQSSESISSASDQLAPSLVRKEGQNITIHGRNFHLVEVNPEFVEALNYPSPLSQTFKGGDSAN